MLEATVESSSDSVGEPATICWNKRQHIALQRFDLRILRSVDLGDGFHGGAHERIQLRVFRDLHALQALGKDKQALVGHAHDFVHHGEAADGIQVGRLRGVHTRLALGHHDNRLVVAQGINQLHRALAAYRQGQHGMREQHGVAHRQKRQRAGLIGVIPELRIRCQRRSFCLVSYCLRCDI